MNAKQLIKKVVMDLLVKVEL